MPCGCAIAKRQDKPKMEELLAFWDRAYEAIAMPWFDNINIDYLGFRLEVYRRENWWRLLFHSVVWRPAADGLMVLLEPVGPDVAPHSLHSFTPATLEYADDDTLSSLRVRGEAVDCATLKVQPNFDLQPEYLFWVGVALLAVYPTALFATAEEKAVCVPPGAEPLLVLTEWDHPTWDRLPSQTETFPRLAEVLITGEPQRWRPVAAPNTHWAHWLPK
ncbi:MAG: hypothetical protein SNJ60_00390 [Pseudanabaenaceae cyanobacterium]